MLVFGCSEAYEHAELVHGVGLIDWQHVGCEAEVVDEASREEDADSEGELPRVDEGVFGRGGGKAAGRGEAELAAQLVGSARIEVVGERHAYKETYHILAVDLVGRGDIPDEVLSVSNIIRTGGHAVFHILEMHVCGLRIAVQDKSHREALARVAP